MSIYRLLTHRYLLRYKRQSLYTLIGIISSVALLTSIGTFIVSYQEHLLNQAENDQGRYHMQVNGANAEMIHKIKANPNVQNVGLFHREEVTTVQGQSLDIISMEEVAYSLLPFHMLKQSNSEEQGLIVERWVAAQLDMNMDVGQQLTYINHNGAEGSAVVEQVVANLPTNNDQPRLKAYRLTTEVDESNASMLIQLDTKGDINAVRDQLKKWVAPEQIVLNRQLLSAQQMKVEEEETLGYGGYEFLYFVPSFILVIATVAFIYNTFQISVAQRIRHIGLMRALGATRRHVRNMVLYEATLLSLIAIPIGLFCGVGVVWFVTSLFKIFFEGGEFSLLHIQIIVSPAVLGISSIISLVAVYLSVWLPTRTAGRVSPLAVIREGYPISKRKRKAKKLKIFSRLAGIETRITYRSMRSNKRRLYSTIFSLALSVFIFSTFTGMARVLSAEIAGVEQHADFTVYNYSSQYNPIMEQLPKQLNKLNEIKHIYVNYPDYSVQTIVPANSKTSMLGHEVMVDQTKHRSLYGTLSMYVEDNELWLKSVEIEGDITAVNDDREYGVIFVQKEGPNKLQLHVGDELYLAQTEMNRDQTTYDSSQLFKTRVLAVIKGDPSFPTFIANRKVTEALFPDVTDSHSVNSIDITLKNIEQERQVGERLEAMVEQDPRLEVRSHLQAKRESNTIQMQLLVMLYGFIGVIVLISILNMVNTIMMNFIARTKEFAMLQSVGMSRHALHAMLVKEGILYGVLSGIIGVIFAGLIMFKLSSGSQPTGSHATVPEAWIWFNLVITFLGTVLIGYLSARIALKSYKGVNLIHLLKEE